MKSVLLQELIKREMHQTDFIYNDDDRAILSRMFDDLNSKTGANYHYLAEIAFQLAPNIGTIILPYFDLFHSESVRAYLVPQLVFDKIPSCDSVIYNGYLRFKQSSFYIPEKGKAAPTHICTRYDQAFKTLKPKKLKDELGQLANHPRDIVYLPFTMKMLASWKYPDLEKQIVRYFSAMTLPSEEFGIPKETEYFFPTISFMRKQLLLYAISCSVYYPSSEIKEHLQSLLTYHDSDIQMAAKKSFKKVSSIRSIGGTVSTSQSRKKATQN